MLKNMGKPEDNAMHKNIVCLFQDSLNTFPLVGDKINGFLTYYSDRFGWMAANIIFVHCSPSGMS